MSVPTSKVHVMLDRLSEENPFWEKGEYESIDVDGLRCWQNVNADSNNVIQETAHVSAAQIPKRADPLLQLAAVQRLLDRLEYNFLPKTFFTLTKNRSLSRIIATGKEIIQESLPIRCLEATFVGLVLTQHLNDVQRFPITFKSACNGCYYRHIVLGVRYKGVYGSLGLSRKGDLKDKPFTFHTLTDLISDYAAAYRGNGHVLVSIKIGLFFSHDALSKKTPCWRYISLRVPSAIGTADCGTAIQKEGECKEFMDTLFNLTELLTAMSTEFDDLLCQTNIDGMTPVEVATEKARKAQQQHHLSSGGKVKGRRNKGGKNAADMSDSDSSDDDDEEEFGSDSEENQRRVQCIRQMKSPFHTNIRVGPPSASAAGKLPSSGARNTKFSDRLRSNVRSGARHEAPSCITACVDSEGQQQRKQLQVPPPVTVGRGVEEPPSRAATGENRIGRPTERGQGVRTRNRSSVVE